MSFAFSAGGTRQETTGSLRKLTFTDGPGGGPGLGAEVRDLIASRLEDAADVPAGSRYHVSASGHSGEGSIFTLSVTVAVRPQPVPA